MDSIVSVTAQDGSREQALCNACGDKDIKLVREILQSGVNLNCHDGRGTPLFLAAYIGSTQCVSALIETNANVNFVPNSRTLLGDTPLHA